MVVQNVYFSPTLLPSMRHVEMYASGIVLLGLALVISGCDSGSGPSLATERVIAEVEAPTSVMTNESFQVMGRAFGEKTNGSRVPVDSVKLFVEGTLTGNSPGGSALTIDIDSSMTSVGKVNVMVRAWKTAQGERLSDETSQDIKVLESSP